MITLLSGSDELYGFLLGGPPPVPGLTLPPGGISPEPILAMLREMLKPVRAAHGGSEGCGGDWAVLDGTEVVGLCSLKAPAGSDGTVEIGYGMAPSRWGRGYATAAVGLMLAEIACDPQIALVTAETAVANIASQRVLEKNGFVPTGRRIDPEDGEVICWRLS